MIRFENEFIFLNGEYQFVARVSKILDFQTERFNVDFYSSKCCNLCAFKDYRYKNCPVNEDHVLVKIKYFELYKDWENQLINKYTLNGCNR